MSLLSSADTNAQLALQAHWSTKCSTFPVVLVVFNYESLLKYSNLNTVVYPKKKSEFFF